MSRIKKYVAKKVKKVTKPKKRIKPVIKKAKPVIKKAKPVTKEAKPVTKKLSKKEIAEKKRIEAYWREQDKKRKWLG